MSDPNQLYTMAQAARRKGVSYQSVYKAVRDGKLPTQRLGRQRLVTGADLDAWQPMRQRTPHKYRLRDPDLTVIGASLDQVSLDRATLEAEVTELATALARRTGELSFEQLHNALRVLLQIIGDWKL
jgi:excisionase family DNA binding protein